MDRAIVVVLLCELNKLIFDQATASAIRASVSTTETGTPGNSTTADTAETSESVGHRRIFTYLVILCGIIIATTIAVVGVCFWLTSRLNKRFNTPRQDLLVLVKDAEATVNIDNLKDKCSEIIKMNETNDKSKVEAMFAKVVNKEKEASAKAEGKTEMVNGARDAGTLPILKETRVQLAVEQQPNLHISKLADLYKNPLYLSAAPSPEQFENHWKVIWQEKIGVIVWIGRFESHDGKHRMDAYIGEKEGSSVRYGDFSITTVKLITKYGRFHVYLLDVQCGGTKRQLTIVHAYEWLQSTISWAMRRDVHTVLTVKREHCRQIVQGLPGVMFQCKFGTAGSATLLAVYIGYQTWLRCRKVNVFGILAYIRSQRLGAFEITGDPEHTFLLQLQVVYTVMYAMARFGSTGTVPLVEVWIRDIWGR